MAVIVVTAFVYWLRPDLVAHAGAKIAASEAFLAAMLAAPLAVLAWSVRPAMGVLFPASASQNAKLRAWPEYCIGG
jgi:hypothetical protein